MSQMKVQNVGGEVKNVTDDVLNVNSEALSMMIKV